MGHRLCPIFKATFYSQRFEIEASKKIAIFLHNCLDITVGFRKKIDAGAAAISLLN